MSTEEDQSMEVEALQSIYGEDFSFISEIPRSFEICLLPNSSDSDDNYIGVILCITFPVDYPNILPDISFRIERGDLTDRHLSKLVSLSKEKAQQSLGSVSIFNICEAVKEWLQANNKENLDDPSSSDSSSFSSSSSTSTSSSNSSSLLPVPEDPHAIKKRGRSPLGIEPGTLVTPESFAHWRTLFEEEQKIIRELKEREAGLKKDPSKLTGRQLFLQNLVNELDEDSEGKEGNPEGGEEGTKEEKVFWYNEGLYEDEENEDLDEEDQGEEEEEQTHKYRGWREEIGEKDEQQEEENDDSNYSAEEESNTIEIAPAKAPATASSAKSNSSNKKAPPGSGAAKARNAQ